MTAIYKRELKTFFTTVTGWLFIAAHICLAGLYFFAINLLSGYSNVGQSFSSILFFAAVIDTDSVHAYAGRGA